MEKSPYESQKEANAFYNMQLSIGYALLNVGETKAYVAPSNPLYKGTPKASVSENSLFRSTSRPLTSYTQTSTENARYELERDEEMRNQNRDPRRKLRPIGFQYQI